MIVFLFELPLFGCVHLNLRSKFSVSLQLKYLIVETCTPLCGKSVGKASTLLCVMISTGSKFTMCIRPLSPLPCSKIVTARGLRGDKSDRVLCRLVAHGYGVGGSALPPPQPARLLIDPMTSRTRPPPPTPPPAALSTPSTLIPRPFPTLD